MAFRPVDHVRASRSGPHLLPWLARASPARSIPLARGPSRCFLRRTPCDLPGLGFAHRAFCCAAPTDPHVAAHATDDGRAPTSLARSTAVSSAPRSAAIDSVLLGQTAAWLAAAAAPGRAFNTSVCGAHSVHIGHLDLALADSL